MKCPDCEAQMTLHDSVDDYNPPGIWEHYLYWMCHECWYSEDAK